MEAGVNGANNQKNGQYIGNSDKNRTRGRRHDEKFCSEKEDKRKVAQESTRSNCDSDETKAKKLEDHWWSADEV